MKRRKKDYRQVRNLSLPNWLKLRMTDSMLSQAKWMIDSAEICNADKVRLRLAFKRRPWVVTMEVKRYGH